MAIKNLFVVYDKLNIQVIPKKIDIEIYWRTIKMQRPVYVNKSNWKYACSVHYIKLKPSSCLRRVIS
jgi:hypothetical protein